MKRNDKDQTRNFSGKMASDFSIECLTNDSILNKLSKIDLSKFTVSKSGQVIKTSAKPTKDNDS